ncbi:response regulator transcription factor [Bradyrhizobium elkanii]|uniref:response regulator transcription factor n=1 Tax=Bradyrhizobium elkanii TaxID=29448 RepID=UPI0005C17247|nr:response regulator transcription factor [Bradyrhizobium elkanii]KIU48716.1 Nodulation protein W [Bradyrhizobium elkanii]
MTDQQSVIFVIDDDLAVREALDSLFQSTGLNARFFESTDAFLQSERPDVPGCLVLDVRLPGLSGLDFQREMIKSGIHLPIIFITGHGDVPMSVRAMKAGATEFLTKPFQDQDLLDAIHAGFEKDMVRRRKASDIAALQERSSTLTSREREIMAFVVAGQLNKQIAAMLGLSEITVKVHRGQLMRKMQAKSVVDLVRMADQLSASFDNQQSFRVG